MRDLVDVTVDGEGVATPAGGAGRVRGRRVTMNRAESPLGWLRSHGLVDARQFDAGERLRADYERACLAPSVTMRWDVVRVDGGGGAAMHETEAQLAAKRRFDAATGAAGPGLSDVLWRHRFGIGLRVSWHACLIARAHPSLPLSF